MSPTRRDVVVGALLAPALARSMAQPEAPEPGPADLRRDADLLARTYTALHPGLHRYATPDAMRARFAELGDRLAASTTFGERFLALAACTAAVRCGHSYPNPYNQRRAVRDRIAATADRLPLCFTWIDRRMVVLDGLGDARLPRGSEVVAVDGVASGEVLAHLLPLARADGGNDAKRIRSLDVRGDDRFEAFDLYRSFADPAATARGEALLEVRRPGARASERLAVGLATSAERTRRRVVAAPPPASTTPDAPVWTMERRPGGVAVLTMPTWGLYDSPWNWRAWLDAQVDGLVADRAPGLVVDLRGNEGGMDCGDVLAERLVAGEVALQTVLRRTRYRRVPDDLAPFLDTWDDTFRDWGSDARGPDADGFYRMTRFDDTPDGDNRIRPRGLRYAGRVVVLVDAANSSATFQFAEFAKERGLATLVGETTGGNRRGINGGAFFFLRLPATGIEVDVPLVGLFRDRPMPDAGVEPDVPVARSAADLAAGIDRAMDTALRLAAGA